MFVLLGASSRGETVMVVLTHEQRRRSSCRPKKSAQTGMQRADCPDQVPQGEVHKRVHDEERPRIPEALPSRVAL